MSVPLWSIPDITPLTALRIANGAITPITPMPARRTAITALTGFTAASSSALDRGTTGAGAADTATDSVADTVIAADTAIAVVMQAAVMSAHADMLEAA